MCPDLLYILKEVSRSFYVSIRFLPFLMREPIALAYLLARASDTIADTAEVDGHDRVICLNLFAQCFKNSDAVLNLNNQLVEHFIPRQINLSEKKLLEHITDVFEAYKQIDQEPKDWIDKVLDEILLGQRSDLAYFTSTQKIYKSDQQLEEYCDRVAGSVGIFWTNVGFGRLKCFSNIEKRHLCDLGRKYGRGLQLINILRDLPNDLKAGRCYFPDQDPSKPDLLWESIHIWKIEARKLVQDGLVYAKSLQSKRAKVCTALPALIGLDTLDLLDQASWEELEKGIKVSRKRVYQNVFKALWI